MDGTTRSFTGVQGVHNGVGKWKKGCKLRCLQPFNPLSGAYRNRTDDLLTARTNWDISIQLHHTIIHYITKTNKFVFPIYSTHFPFIWQFIWQFQGNNF